MPKAATTYTFNIDYRLEGSITVEARDADAAQDWFDKQLANGTPRWFETNGEVSNDKPYLSEPSRR